MSGHDLLGTRLCLARLGASADGPRCHEHLTKADGEWTCPAGHRWDGVAQRLDGPFTCPVCGMTSHHPTDKAEGYCGACRAYTGAEPVRLGTLPALTVEELRVAQDAIHGALTEAVDLPGGPAKATRLAILRSLTTAVAEAILGARPPGPVPRDPKEIEAAREALRRGSWAEQYAAMIRLRVLGIAIEGRGYGPTFQWVLADEVIDRSQELV